MDVAAAFSDMLSDVAAYPYSGNVAVIGTALAVAALVSSATSLAARWLLWGLSVGALGVFVYGYLVPQLPPFVQTTFNWASAAALCMLVLYLVGSGAVFLLMLWAEGRCGRRLEANGVPVRLSAPDGALLFLWASRRLSSEQWEVFARLVDDADAEVLRLAAPRDLLRYVQMASIL